MSAPTPSAPTAANMVPPTVQYGDTIFIALPAMNPPQIVTGYGGDDSYINVGSGNVSGAYAFTLVSPSNKKGTVFNGDIVYIMDAASQTNFWYNENDTDYVEFVSGESGESHAEWIVQLTNSSNGGLPIKYGDQINLQSQNDQQYPYADGSGQLYVGDNTTPTSPNGVFSFLYGPVNTALLECCTNNPIYNGVCGIYQGTAYSGSCDTILTNYCGAVGMVDPNCGCLLPASDYALNTQFGP
ncbi:MAG: putative virion-associated membrane protein, partial [Satyrvirus sp.]